MGNTAREDALEVFHIRDQRHQREDPALAVNVHAHRDGDVFDVGNNGTPVSVAAV